MKEESDVLMNKGSAPFAIILGEIRNHETFSDSSVMTFSPKT